MCLNAKSLQLKREEEREHRRLVLEDMTFRQLQAIRRTLLEKHWAYADDIAFGSREQLTQWIIDNELPSLTVSMVNVTASHHEIPFNWGGNPARDKFIRTGIQMNDDGGASVDVLRPDGSFFCRLNISICWDDGNGCVDFILDEDATTKVMASHDYNDVLSQELPERTLVMVEVRTKQC